MPISDFADMMNDTVTVTPFSSYDGYGKPTYGTSVSYPNSRVRLKVQQIIDFEGNDVIAGGDVRLGSSTIIGVTDKMTLPDGTTPKILNSMSVPDEAGDSYTRVFFR